MLWECDYGFGKNFPYFFALYFKVTLIEPAAVATEMQPYTPEEKQQKVEKLEMLKAEYIAACIVYSFHSQKGAM